MPKPEEKLTDEAFTEIITEASAQYEEYLRSIRYLAASDLFLPDARSYPYRWDNPLTLNVRLSS